MKFKAICVSCSEPTECGTESSRKAIEKTANAHYRLHTTGRLPYVNIPEIGIYRDGELVTVTWGTSASRFAQVEGR